MYFAPTHHPRNVHGAVAAHELSVYRATEGWTAGSEQVCYRSRSLKRNRVSMSAPMFVHVPVCARVCVCVCVCVRVGCSARQ